MPNWLLDWGAIWLDFSSSSASDSRKSFKTEKFISQRIRLTKLSLEQMPNTISHGSHDYPDYSKSILLLKVNHHHNVISQNLIVICSSSMQFFNSKPKARQFQWYSGGFLAQNCIQNLLWSNWHFQGRAWTRKTTRLRMKVKKNYISWWKWKECE